jgi:hypothetical protein
VRQRRQYARFGVGDVGVIRRINCDNGWMGQFALTMAEHTHGPKRVQLKCEDLTEPQMIPTVTAMNTIAVLGTPSPWDCLNSSPIATVHATQNYEKDFTQFGVKHPEGNPDYYQKPRTPHPDAAQFQWQA